MQAIAQALAKESRLATRIIRTQVRDRVQYPGRLIADTLTIVSRCGLLLLLYWYVFNLRGGSVQGVLFAEVAWSMFFYFAFSTLRLREISRSIMADVQSGSVEMLLSRPISYIAYRFWWQLGSGVYPFAVAVTLGSAALAFTLGVPKTMTAPLFLPTLFIAFLGATALSLILYTMVGLLAFWIEEINPIFWIIDKTIMILGGSYLPIALFPPFLYRIALYSPFGASQFITHTVSPSWQSNWHELVGIQIFWIFVLGFCLYRMFARARLQVSVNGG